MIFETSLRAFHGDPEIKEKYLARIRAHAAADEIVHGIYWQNGKGCAVGCTVHSNKHSAYETELGIPRILAKIEDNIFESLSNGRAKLWPEQFLEAPRVGADLSMVWPQFAVWLLIDPQYGVIQFSKSKKAIQNVADAYQKIINKEVDNIDWPKLRDAAYAAYAAYAADAAYAYADAADAAYADAAAAAAARQKFRNAQADKLIELMEAAQ